MHAPLVLDAAPTHGIAPAMRCQPPSTLAVVSLCFRSATHAAEDKTRGGRRQEAATYRLQQLAVRLRCAAGGGLEMSTAAVCASLCDMLAARCHVPLLSSRLLSFLGCDVSAYSPQLLLLPPRRALPISAVAVAL